MNMETTQHTNRKAKVLNRETLQAIIKQNLGKTIHLLTSNQHVREELKLLGKWEQTREEGEGQGRSHTHAQKEYRKLFLNNFHTKVSQLLWNLKRIRLEGQQLAEIQLPKLSFHNTPNGKAINITWGEDHPLKHIDNNLQCRIQNLTRGIRYHQKYTRLGNTEGGIKETSATKILKQFKLNNKQLTLLHLEYVEPHLRTPIKSALGLLESHLKKEELETLPTLMVNLGAFLEMAKLAGYRGDYYYLQAAYPPESLVGNSVTELFVDLVVNSTIDTLTEVYKVEHVLAKNMELLLVLPPQHAHEIQSILEIKCAKIVKPFLTYKERQFNRAKFQKRTLLEHDINFRGVEIKVRAKTPKRVTQQNNPQEITGKNQTRSTWESKIAKNRMKGKKKLFSDTYRRLAIRNSQKGKIISNVQRHHLLDRSLTF